MHFVEYAILALLTYRALGMGDLPRSRRRRLLGAVLLGLSCAAFDEIHQTFTLTRSGRLHDVLLDTAGTLGGALLASARDKRPARVKRTV
jgi:VanZ family protein